jgi:hypothetical protein
LDEVLIDHVLKALDETRVDHWLHAPAIPDALRHHDRRNRHEPVNLHGDVRDLDQMALTKKVVKMMKMAAKKKDDQSLDGLNLVAKRKDDQMRRMKRDDWMDDQNSGARNHGAVVSHPFRTPLFRF